MHQFEPSAPLCNQRCPLHPKDKMVEVKMEIQIALLAVTDIILIDLVMDAMVIMLLQVDRIVTLCMIDMKLVQIVLHPENLKGGIDMTNMHKNMTNLSRVW